MKRIADIEKLEFVQNDGAILKENIAKLDSLNNYVRKELMPLIIQERNQNSEQIMNNFE